MTDASGRWSVSGTQTAVGSYSQFWYVGNIQVGQIQFFVTQVPTVSLTNNSEPGLGSNFYSGDAFTLTVAAGSAAAHQNVTVSTNAGPPGAGSNWVTDSNGNWGLPVSK